MDTELEIQRLLSRVQELERENAILRKQLAALKSCDSLQKGMPFAEAAGKFSDDKYSAVNGGSLGMPFFSYQMVPEFVSVLYGLEEGQYSKPFRSRYGWHIARLDDKSELGSYEDEKKRIAAEVNRNEDRQKIPVHAFQDRLLARHSWSMDEDVLQEVFYKRLYRAPAFASPDHERRWLFRVALNQCRDAWKQASRSELPLEAASPAVTPEELGLLEQVAELPEAQRTVLHLHYWEGYALREIAGILGVTVPTVKMRLKRGRDALRRTWEGSV